MRRAMLPALLIAAAAFRVVAAWEPVLGGDDVRLLGTDAYYHLRHARATATHFPRVNRHDHATHLPDGQRSAAGLYDVAVATLALASPEFVPWAAAWAPVLLVLGAFLALYLLVRRLAGRGRALVACTLLLLYPGESLTRTTLGFADHHAAEILLALLVPLGYLRCLDGSGWRPALLGALPLALFLFTWIGAPIHLLVLAVTVVFESVRGGDAAAPARFGAGLLLLAVPAALLAPRLVLDPRLFWQSMAVAAALPLLLTPALLLAKRIGRPRVTAAALVAGTLLVGALGGAELFREKTRLVAEHRPVTLAAFLRDFGPLVLLAPLGLLALRRRGAPLVLGGAALLLALRFASNDYGYLAGPMLAVAAALAPRPRRIPAWAIALLLLVPLGWTRTPWATRAQVVARLELDDAWSATLRWMRANTPEPALDVDALAERSVPATDAVWTSWEYGSFVPAVARRRVLWSQGVSAELARRLLERDERALDEWLARSGARYWILDAATLGDRFVAQVAAAGRSLAEFGGRVGITPEGYPLRTFGAAFDDTVAARLFLAGGAGVHGFRLVYASPQTCWSGYRLLAGPDGARMRRTVLPAALAAGRGVTSVPGGYLYEGVVVPRVQLFERVPGARLVGTALAGGRVRARVALRSLPGGRVVRWRGETIADSDGGFSIRVPYPTVGGSDRVVALGPYRIEAFAPAEEEPSRRGQVAISEDQVQAGTPVETKLK